MHDFQPRRTNVLTTSVYSTNSTSFITLSSATYQQNTHAHSTLSRLFRHLYFIM